MIYKFRIISDENKEFARELLVGSNHSFLDMHHCLQEDLHYDASQLASFFLTNALWEKELQITLIDMMDDENSSCITMENALLKDHLHEKGARMLYVFDFFSERSFFMELTDILDIKGKKTDPIVIYSHGDPPEQIDLKLDDFGFADENFDDDMPLESYDDEFNEGFDFPDADEFTDD